MKRKIRRFKKFTFNYGINYKDYIPEADHRRWPVSYQYHGGHLVTMFPYQGNIYMLSRPFVIDKETPYTSQYNSSKHKHLYISGWLSKKKPKQFKAENGKKYVECPVTLDELKSIVERYIKWRNQSEENQEQKEKDKVAKYTIENKEITDIKLLQEHHLVDHGWQGTDFQFVFGLEATFSDGTVSKTENFGGDGFLDEYIFEVTGAEEDYYLSKKEGYASSIAFQYSPSTEGEDRTCDCIEVTVKSKYTGEVLLTEKVSLPYDYDLTLTIACDQAYWNEVGEHGADLKVKVEEILHSETWETLVLYTIHYEKEYESGVKYARLRPNQKLFIYHNGGKGGNNASGGAEGGRPGTFEVEVADNVQEYHIDHSSSKGPSGEYEAWSDEYETNSSDSSLDDEKSEIIIINNTGKGVCLVQGGTSQTIGSQEDFDCDDDIYYGVMDGNHCKSIKGSKIADADSDCGRTITLE